VLLSIKRRDVKSRPSLNETNFDGLIMLEDKTLSETAKALGLGSLLPTVYGDLLSPAAKELGEGLATIARAVKISLAPIEAAVWGYERIREWLSIRVTSILAERRAKKIQPPPLSVAGPLIVQMLFASEEPDLREKYAKLLATSMDSATADDAHPSFVTLIQQLTPDEARILHHLASLKQEWPGWTGDPMSNQLQSAMRQVCIDAGVADSTKADLYVDNLLRLRVLRHVDGFEAIAGSPGNSEFIELTSYGRALLEACVIGNNAIEQGDAPEDAPCRE